MSSLFRIRNVQDVNRAVFRFLVKTSSEYGSGFNNLTSERRVAYGCTQKLNSVEIEKAALAMLRFLDFTGECDLYVFDETIADPDDREVFSASFTREYFELKPGQFRADASEEFVVLFKSDSIN